MRNFWWLTGIAFLGCLTVYTVGTGWPSRSTVHNEILHARRQLEPERVLEDLAAARAALRTHYSRVMALSFIFKQPDFSRANMVDSQLAAAQQHFRSLGQVPLGTDDVSLSPQFQAGIQQLERYRVPSISVLPAKTEMWLKVGIWVFGGLTVLLVAVRAISGAER